MDDITIQRKLNQLRKIANELDTEARERWQNPGAGLFYESEGSFHMMSGDADSGALDRQDFVEFTSSGSCRMGCGSW